MRSLRRVVEVPQQIGGYYCGVFTFICAHCVFESLPLLYSQNDVPYFHHKSYWHNTRLNALNESSLRRCGIWKEPLVLSQCLHSLSNSSTASICDERTGSSSSSLSLLLGSSSALLLSSSSSCERLYWDKYNKDLYDMNTISVWIIWKKNYSNTTPETKIRRVNNMSNKERREKESNKRCKKLCTVKQRLMMI